MALLLPQLMGSAAVSSQGEPVLPLGSRKQQLKGQSLWGRGAEWMAPLLIPLGRPSDALTTAECLVALGHGQGMITKGHPPLSLNNLPASGAF